MAVPPEFTEPATIAEFDVTSLASPVVAVNGALLVFVESSVVVNVCVSPGRPVDPVDGP
jgi:hypothetical protein